MVKFILAIFLLFWLFLTVGFGIVLGVHKSNPDMVTSKLQEDFDKKMEEFGSYPNYCIDVAKKYIYVFGAGLLLSILALVCL